MNKDVEVQVDQPNSVEISVNAKGQFSGKVKAYAKTIEEAMMIYLGTGLPKRKGTIEAIITIRTHINVK